MKKAAAKESRSAKPVAKAIKRPKAKKPAKGRTPRGKALIGAKVRFPFGTRMITAVIVDDRGPTGVGGRRWVTLSVRKKIGEVETFDMPLDGLTFISRKKYASAS